MAEPLYLTPREVARMFRVDPRTLARWARDGKIAYILTPGGHRRYPASEVDRLHRVVDKPLRSGPHSRACGVLPHEHGVDCHSNCPTCGGRND